MKDQLPKEHRGKAGVYYILNTRNNRICVGATSAFGYRLSYHLNKLTRNVHHNKALQSDWNTYGETAFEYGILVNVGRWGQDKELEIAKCERIFQHAYQSYDPTLGYNGAIAANAA